MRVTPEQSKKVQEICFENKIFWNGDYNKDKIDLAGSFLYIEGSITHDMNDTESEHFFRECDIEEIDADLFIRTNGTCEENELKNFIQSQNKIKDCINEWAKQFNDIEQKLKKKNEILKKARIKRKNQREELNKLNLKLQKCISLEEHNIITEKLRDTIVSLRDDAINKVDNITYNKNKEIEKLKAVIEYLESKVK